MEVGPSTEFMKKFADAMPKGKKFSGGNKGGDKKSKLAEQMKKNKKK